METVGCQQDQANRRRSARDKRTSTTGTRSAVEIHEERKEDEKIVSFRRHWENCYGKVYGCSFEDTTIVPPMCHTFELFSRNAIPDNGFQIFSIKVDQLKKEEGLQWPLQIYGLIAVRDYIDPRRNLLFHCSRDNCQTITEEDPFMLLTGPSRAVVILDPISFEVQLKVKGQTESEDKVLVFDVFTTQHGVSYGGHYWHPPHTYTSYLRGKRSDLVFTFAVLGQSVEATICVEVVHGSWPEETPVRIAASTASIPHADVVLLDSRDARVPINDSGVIMLSRKAVSVELSGELKVEVKVQHFGEVVKACVFAPKKSTTSCKLGITVGWSLFDPITPGTTPEQHLPFF
ncbi:unnamed protein product [Urochloa decumbens]|uniref:DUF6598 domain-containing protein n=1 Tax=Urochloa decumbens TaxID=240449 RepID=A0ABC8YU34_9POAL